MQEIMSVLWGDGFKISNIFRNHMENLSLVKILRLLITSNGITANMRIQRKNWVDCHYIGLEENLRLRYMGFSQHRMLYCSMLVSHGQSGHSSETEEHLLAILRGFECLCFRTIASVIYFHKFTKKCHSLIPRQANLVKERGLTNELLELLNEYANWTKIPNPSSCGRFRGEELKRRESKRWCQCFTHLKTLLTARLAVRRLKRFRKIGALLPVYNHRDVNAAQVWDYGVD